MITQYPFRERLQGRHGRVRAEPASLGLVLAPALLLPLQNAQGTPGGGGSRAGPARLGQPSSHVLGEDVEAPPGRGSRGVRDLRRRPAAGLPPSWPRPRAPPHTVPPTALAERVKAPPRGLARLRLPRFTFLPPDSTPWGGEGAAWLLGLRSSWVPLREGSDAREWRAVARRRATSVMSLPHLLRPLRLLPPQRLPQVEDHPGRARSQRCPRAQGLTKETSFYTKVTLLFLIMKIAGN